MKKIDLFNKAKVLTEEQISIIGGLSRGSFSHDNGDSNSHDNGDSSSHDNGDSSSHDNGDSSSHDNGDSSSHDVR